MKYVCAATCDILHAHAMPCGGDLLKMISSLLAASLSLFFSTDILVSNAAVNPAGGPILAMEDSAIEKVLQINVQSAIWLTREAVKHMTTVSHNVRHPAHCLSIASTFRPSILQLYRSSYNRRPGRQTMFWTSCCGIQDLFRAHSESGTWTNVQV